MVLDQQKLIACTTNPQIRRECLNGVIQKEANYSRRNITKAKEKMTVFLISPEDDI